MALYCAGFRIWRSPLYIYIKEDMCSKYNHLKEENKMSRVYNFSAGPAVLPEDVLKEAAAEMLDYRGTGMSVMEMVSPGAPIADAFDDTDLKIN